MVKIHHDPQTTVKQLRETIDYVIVNLWDRETRLFAQDAAD